MRKFLFVVVLILFGVFLYCKNNYENENFIKLLKATEEDYFYIDRYTIFGTHLNISACIDKKLDKPQLILKNNKEEILINSVFTTEDKTCFKTSYKNNDSIYLDGLKEGNYIMLVKDNTKYYNLLNNTQYGNITYYTITKNGQNKKININFDNNEKKQYLIFKINKATLPNDIYDITIDAGHGGRDTGARYKYQDKVYNESELTLKIALLLKQNLENNGLRVNLTRDSDITLSNYGKDGRSVIANKSKSKYSLSIHINSLDGGTYFGGVEVYTPNNIDYTLAKKFAQNISNIVGYSKRQTNKITDGVYFTYFDSEKIEEYKNDLLEEGLKPYDIKEGTPYMFMIRELGGINTNAYMDGRNQSHGYNEFYNSNQTVEPYLLELGYINYPKDLENLYNRADAFSAAIGSALKEYIASR